MSSGSCMRMEVGIKGGTMGSVSDIRVLTDDSSNIDATPTSFSSGGESDPSPFPSFFMRCSTRGRLVCMYSDSFDLNTSASYHNMTTIHEA